MHIRYIRRLAIFPIISIFCIFTSVWGEEKTVVYLNSYHAGYDWSDKEFAAFKVQLSDQDVNIHAFYMNTKYIKLMSFCLGVSFAPAMSFASFYSLH